MSMRRLIKQRPSHFLTNMVKPEISYLAEFHTHKVMRGAIIPALSYLGVILDVSAAGGN